MAADDLTEEKILENGIHDSLVLETNALGRQ